MKLQDIKLNTSYTNLNSIFYDFTTPAPLNDAYLMSFNPKAAALIKLDEEEAQSQDFIDFINGKNLLEGSKPFSMCYAGHQFGHFVPQLGDGRAINLGETEGWNLQLKGAGPTAYSRRGDGRAVLRSSIREYLMSEAMFALGVPTTRALAIIGSEHNVRREDWEKGAIVLRMSTSWVRFGTFEYFYYSDKHDKLEQLADYVINQSYPHLKGKDNAYFLMYEEIVKGTAEMLAHWQSIGFNHGVMNTDNMSIESLTIDYGPYAFLDAYDFNYICNHTDQEGRYAFGNQPPVAYWNLSMLARALSPILNIQRSEEALENFGELFTAKYMELMRAKLGFEVEDENDLSHLKHLLGVLGSSGVDYTAFFRRLSHYSGDRTDLLALCDLQTPLDEWLDDYDKRLKLEKSEDRNEKMLRSNPKYILKNYILQEAIDLAEAGDNSLVNDLFNLAQNPFDEHPEFERYAQATPSSYQNLKLSCSS
jgi:uncharacterized protein YdiU (UPF0061 family)